MQTQAQNDSVAARGEAAEDARARWRVLQAGEYVWRIAKEVSGNEEWLSHPERIVAYDANLLKEPIPGSGTRVARMATSTGSFVVKEYRPPDLRTICDAVIRGPRAVRTFEMLFRLQKLGVPAIHPLAAAHERGRPWHSILVTEQLAPAQRLYDYAAHSRRNRSRIIAPLARMFASLHNAGLLHRDAHHANFLITGENVPKLYLVDVDGMREAKKITFRDALRDISRLLVHLQIPKQERLRFALIYCRERRPPLDVRRFVSLFDR